MTFCLLERRLELELIGYEWGILAFVLWCLFSYAVSDYKFSTQLEILDVFSYLIFLYLLRQVLRDIPAETILWAVSIACILQALMCLWQFYIQHLPRAHGTFFNGNYAASFLLGGLIVSAGFLMRGRLRWIHGPLALLFSWAVICTGSRSGGLGLVLILVLCVAKMGKRMLLPALVLLLAFAVVPNPARDRLLLFKRTDQYAFERVRIWEKSLEIVRDHPVMGVGLGNFDGATYAYNFPVESAMARYKKRFKSPHNSYLLVAAELGVPGFLLFAALIVLVLWQPFSGKRTDTKDGDPEGLLLVAAGVILLLLFEGLFMDVVRSPPNVFLGLTALAILSRLQGAGSGKKRNLMVTGPLLGGPMAAAAVLLWTVVWPYLWLSPYVAMTYERKAEREYGRSNLKEAEAKLQRAIRYNPRQPYYRASLAGLSLANYFHTRSPKEIQKALRDYSSAIRLNPTEPDFFFKLAECLEILYRGAGKPDPKKEDEIAAAYARAIKLNPKNPFYRFRAALFFLSANRPGEAVRQLEAALDLEPTFLAAMDLLEKVYAASGSAAEARAIRGRRRLVEQRLKDRGPDSPYERLLWMDPDAYIKGILRRLMPS